MTSKLPTRRTRRRREAAGSDDGEQPGGQIAQWVQSWITLVGPASLLSALLFYFGYVASRSQYEYFGVDVDAIGLSTQDYIMRSPQPLLVPLLVLTLTGAGLLALDATVRQRLVTGSPTRAARGLLIGGLSVLGTGVVLVFAYPVARVWLYYDLITPLLFAVGGGLVAYARRIYGLRRAPSGRQAADDASTTVGHADLLRRVASMFLYMTIGTSVFWATATVAQWSGRGLAQEQAAHLDQLPHVILDTKERMFLRSPGVEETQLPAAEGQYRYRYRHLRLLIVGDERMFLVPEKWSASNSTLVVRLDDSVRVQFQFHNERPRS